MFCWRVFKWVPVLLIVSIVAWSYYAYVIQLCFFTITSTVQQSVYLIIYHILLFMFAWSYWRTIFAEIKPVPDKFKLPEAELEKLLSAESEDAQRSVLDNFSKDLPVVTRIITAARKGLRQIGVLSKPQRTIKKYLERKANSIPVLLRTMSGSVRYCSRCVLIKPDRAHHCSICSRCVLKMDHHCPWVNNCVCFFNYKFFMLFLGYALLYCLFTMATCLPYFITFWKGLPLHSFIGKLLVQHFKSYIKMYEEYTNAHCDRMLKNGTYSKHCVDMLNGEIGTAASTGRYHIVFAFFVSLMFAISLGSLFGYHCYLVINNRTTLEAFRAPMFRGGADKNGFSIGYFNNFKEVFGESPNLWILPVFSSLGDGCEFPVRREHDLQTFTTPQEPHGYESMGTTRSSFGDGIVYPLPQQEEDTESLLSSERWDRWGERATPFDERESSSLDEI